MFSADQICTMIRHLIGDEQPFVVITQRDVTPVNSELEDVQFDIAGFGDDGDVDTMLAVAGSAVVQEVPSGSTNN